MRMKQGQLAMLMSVRFGAVRLIIAIQVYDETTPGLALRVTSGGSRTFVIFKRLNGRTVRMKLGSNGSLP